MTAQYDVMVIGGGIAGLIAAATVAREGHTVAVLEGTQPGGRARTTERSGFGFNQGPHALYLNGSMAQACRALGVSVAGGPPLLDQAGIWAGGSIHAMPSSARGLIRTKLLGWRAKTAAAKVFKVLERADAAPYARVSVSELLDGLGAPGDLRALVEMLARLQTYADAPGSMSAEAFLLQHRLTSGGVVYPDAGWGSLVAGLADAARGAGAVILDHHPVSELGREADSWLAVTPAGQVTASSVVIAVGLPAEAARLAGASSDIVDAAGPAVRAACLDLGIDRPAQVPLLLAMDEPYYLSTHSPPAKLAPEGQLVVQVAEYLAPDRHPDRASTEAGLWRHAERAGIAKEHVVASRYLHDMVVAGGLPLAATGGLRARPSVVVEGRPGLFLAGDWVGPDGLLADAAAASGLAAGRACLAATTGRR